MKRSRLTIFGILALLAAAILYKAWVTDDAYITFRSVQNLLHGQGPTWNPSERVQVFTHPLWMFLMSIVAGVTREFYFTSIFLNLGLTGVAVAILAFRIAGARHTAALALAVVFASRAFTDYATSGLENPLTHVLLALFLAAFFDSTWAVVGRPGRSVNLTGLTLLFSAALLTRLDNLMLFGPPMCVAVWSTWRANAGIASVGSLPGAPHPTRWKSLLFSLGIGLAPLLAWEAFSLVYYGFLVPNTAYAKLNTGIPAGELAVQGWHYLMNSLRWDPITLVATLFAVGAALVSRNLRKIAVAMGIVLHLMYVVRVGGDFMSGRFLTPSLLAAVILIAHSRMRVRPTWIATVLLVAVSVGVPYYSPFAKRDYGKDWHAAIDTHGISDERVYYEGVSTLRDAFGQDRWPHPQKQLLALHLQKFWYEDGFLPFVFSHHIIDKDERWPPRELLPQAGRRPSGGKLQQILDNYHPVVIRGAVGYIGFYLGPGVHVLDFHGLADPLLARLPAQNPDPVHPSILPQIADRNWRIGHFTRRIPQGYVETISAGENRIADADLAEYYEVLHIITQGPLFTGERWTALWNLHTGRYNSLLSVQTLPVLR